MSSTMVVAAVVLAIACLLAGPALIPSTGMLDELILPVLQKLPLLDGLAGSPLAKHNMPWGLNPSPTISSAAPELPSKVSFLRPAALAVLSKEGPFKRKRLEPLKSTKLAPAGAELQSQSIASGLQDSAFVAFDERFLRLIGEKPTLWRLAQRDYEFAHEVRASLLPHANKSPISAASVWVATYARELRVSEHAYPFGQALRDTCRCNHNSVIASSV